ncbi:FAD-dependent oxidoreductase [Anaerotruncus sp. AF02-27]|uniref:NAD(P)/FAD-dependent oxidoreductase n=1 Tax=Anaerotruncus sp. AF02-27 TaxID=2292191 RepID=UPI000E53FD3E|nr:FAD-dependent oxidoreductase [Anaerotruncus sp. AF02-27]RGX55997.1 FAD-dependent oxidoreductase [Anaerotruncus sp. AF02-27]
MKNHYDIAIIGGGIGGLMAAYRLSENDPSLSIVLFEKGNPLGKRICPIITKQVKTCIKCKSCAIMEGLAGAGAFSDGKYVISTEYGGWLTEFLPDETVIDYIEQADKILVNFGATTERFQPNNDLKKLCIGYDLHMAQAQLKHLGTDSNFDTMMHLINSLEGRVEIHTKTNVSNVERASRTLTVQDADGEHALTADRIIFAVGRAGSMFFSDWCEKNNVPLHNNQVDIGVRVELPSIVWEDFSKKIYEPKIWYRSKRYGDTTRMFCFNDRGQVVTENTNGVLTVNGHSYRDESRKTQNSNFALLSTTNFTQPFKEPIEYARYVASLANLISGGSVLVQRLGDLMNGRRTDEKRLRQGTVRPTLSAVPGDLSLCMPKRQLDNIIETLQALDQVSPGTANYDTLLYGIECKYYSARPKCDEFEIEGCPGIYAVGDGAGFTRSLSQAAANGLYVADLLTRKK